MSGRLVVNLATGRYIKGQQRLMTALWGDHVPSMTRTTEPAEWPQHKDVPYAFKAFMLKAAADRQIETTLLWCDASIVPIRSLDPLWDKIEAEGAWISENGYTNYEWTADSAYQYLFSDEELSVRNGGAARCREVNRAIPHVVATAFGISLAHPTGRAILDEYYRLASETRAFCGPWINADHPGALGKPVDGVRVAPCGTPDVRGHRHDQTALSVIAWRLGVKLTNPPAWFAYKGGETADTILVADGQY